MEIGKAIEILTDILRNVKPGDLPDEHDAIKLSTGALIRIQATRHVGIEGSDKALPGETWHPVLPA